MGRIRDKVSFLTLALAKESGGGGTTTNYNDLSHRPKVNGKTLEGNMSTSDLDIKQASMSVENGVLKFNEG